MLVALRGKDDAARIRALLALEAGEAPIDEKVCHVLIALSADPRKEVSRRAAGALSRVAAEAPYQALIEDALGDGDPLRRWSAAFALARAGVTDDAVVHAAIEALALPDGDIRWAAAEIVCKAAREHPKIAKKLGRVAGSTSPEQRKMALYCLRDVGAAAAAAFTTALDDSDRRVRLAGLAGLARSKSLTAAARERLIACACGDTDDGVRRAAVAAATRVAANDDATAAALSAAKSRLPAARSPEKKGKKR